MAGTNSSYGYATYYKPPRQTLAQAAAAKDPYGLAPNNRSGPLGIGSSTGFAAPSPQSTTTQAHVLSPTSSAAEKSLASSALGLGGATAVQPRVTPTAAAVNSYDLNTDPALQQILALTGLNDQQAQATALQERQQQLLAYGDPTIAAAVLGQNDPLVTAAAQNPTSTVAQLGQQKDRNLKQLEDALGAANLGYSGYRVTQETQAAQDFQNALAQAAAGLNSNLGGIDQSLAQALQQNALARAQGTGDAEARAAAAAAQAGVDPGAVGPGSGGPATGGNPFANTGGFGGGSSSVATANNVPSGIQGAILAALLAQQAGANRFQSGPRGGLGL